MPEQHLSMEPYFLRRISACVAIAAASIALMGPAEAQDVENGPGDEISITAPAMCAPPPDTTEGFSDLMGKVEGWDSGDGISSVRLPSGAIIISTGDNMGSDTRGQSIFRRNAMLSVCGDKAKTIVKNDEAVPSINGEWYWPGEMVADEQQGKLYVFSNRIAKVREPNEQHGADLGSFVGTGIDLAVFSLPESADEDPEFMYMAKTPASDSAEIDPDGQRRNKQWGASVVESNDGYLYVYGSLLETRPYSFGRDAYVARVPAGQLESPDAWEYYSGDGWSEDESSAIPVIDSEHQPGLDVTWTTAYEDGRVTIVSKRNGVYGTELGEWTAPALTGPFTYRKLADLPSYKPEAMTYNAHIHPDITLEHGGMLISVCQGSNGDFEAITGNPASHRPIWLDADSRRPLD